jgi:antitoxin component YwqK of YwqJK toxin-antitoxin module
LLLLFAVVAALNTAVTNSDNYRDARERSRYGMTSKELPEVARNVRRQEMQTVQAIQDDLDRTLQRKGARRLAPLVSLGEQAVRTPDGPTMCLVLETRVAMASGFETVIQLGFGNSRLGPVGTRGTAYGRLSNEGPMMRGTELRAQLDRLQSEAVSKVEEHSERGVDPGDELEEMAYGESPQQRNPNESNNTTGVTSTRAASTDVGGSYVDGEKDGPWTYWHENARKKAEGAYRIGKKVGVWTHWHDNGVKAAEGSWKGGRKEGVWNYWHPNRQRSTSGTYKNDKAEGTWIAWHENGRQRREDNYKDGRKEGVHYQWHPNGQKRIEGHFKDDLEHGRWTGWHDNGVIQVEGSTYENGKEEGVWTYRDRQGRVTRTETYRAGRLVK